LSFEISIALSESSSSISILNDFLFVAIGKNLGWICVGS
jgi:hypothetical protein